MNTKTKTQKMDKAVEEITLYVKEFLKKNKLDADIWTDDNSERLAKKLNMKRERDPDVPKRPLSGFMRFQAEVRNREGIKTEFPRSSDLAKEASRLWKELSAEEKAEYEEAYQEDLQKYKEMKGEAHTHSSDSDSGCSHSSSDGCHHVFPRGAKKGEVCGVVGCKKHHKPMTKSAETKETNETKETKGSGCRHVFPRGEHKGEVCGVVGCKKHKKEVEKKEEVKEEEEDLEEETVKEVEETVKEEVEDLEEEEVMEEKEEVCVYRYPEGHTHAGVQCGRDCEEGLYCKKHSGVMAVKEKVEREEREEKTKVKEVVCRHQFTRGANKGSMCGKVNCKLHE